MINNNKPHLKKKILPPAFLLKLPRISSLSQRYTYRVLQTIQTELILLCDWADPAILCSAKTALKFKYEI